MRPYRTLSVLTSAAIAAMLVSPAAVADSRRDPLPLLDPGPRATAEPPAQLDDEWALTLPIVPEGMARLASDLAEQFGDDPDFSAVEVTEDRSRVVVHWYGQPSDAIESSISRASGVATEFAPVEYRPGDLRQAAAVLLTDPSVASVSIPPDSSRLEISLHEALNTPGGRTASTDWSARAGFPVSVELDAPTPAATRQNDINYHLGGARIYRFEDPFIRGGCSSGFAVVRASDPSQQGTMLAAHCGGVGSRFVTSDGTFAYHYGDMVARDTTHDGAILSMAWSQPFVWTNTWDSNVYTQVNGVASPYVGQELCYSGSYSGLVCGNIVRATGVAMNLGGDLTAVSAFRTENASGIPSAGNGDSGGPGYQLVNTVNGARRWAVGIISAIPSNSPTACRGVPGDVNGRRCSPTVFSTSVVLIGNRTGWYVPST